MGAQDLLTTLSQEGIQISLDGDTIEVDAPKGALTNDLRQAIREHKPELLKLLQPELAPLGKVGRHSTPCPKCGDTWKWPTSRGGWVCSWCICAVPGDVQIAKPGGDIVEATPNAQPEWIRERNLDPQSVAEAFQRYATDRPGETQQHLSVGTLLSVFNLWLEEQGQRPTTLPVLREAMGMPSASKPLRAEIARCPKCGGTDWGSSGRHTGDGAEVWCCITCANQHTPIAAKMGEPDPAYDEGAI